ncbi:N-acetylneuraminate synthase [Acidaminococcus massiliensis]|uniref:N-acetylneuraminate synthase n=1 Tax=Acidaminococcus massiliensis TaxID=1852375 RepID=UPI0026DC7302|nr:N-acetylneuraminate synthase [Acidaminococcus massiliensis]
MKHVYIVAEIGCNHNGSRELARLMVEKAKECGVDAVKFQTFKADALISRYAPKAEYQKVTTGTEDSQLAMTRKLELMPEDYLELKKYAESLGLDVFSTAFDMPSIHFLEENNQHVWKIPSGEITNLPYLEEIGSFNCPNKKILLSTGMATLQEIQQCLDILEKAGTKAEEITILHCNTEYPTPDQDVNVLAIDDLKKHFPGYQIGFSDHSVGYIAAVGASILGIAMIEKHFTLNKDFPGPDHQASATPEELRALCHNVRRMEVLAGEGKKIVTASEKKNKIVARKSIVASRNIKKGELFTPDNLTCKRPGNGISPLEWYQILGKTAEKDFCEDQLIEASGFKWQE